LSLSSSSPRFLSRASLLITTFHVESGHWKPFLSLSLFKVDGRSTRILVPHSFYSALLFATGSSVPRPSPKTLLPGGKHVPHMYSTWQDPSPISLHYCSNPFSVQRKRFVPPFWGGVGVLGFVGGGVLFWFLLWMPVSSPVLLELPPFLFNGWLAVSSLFFTELEKESFSVRASCLLEILGFSHLTSLFEVQFSR